MQKIIFAKRSLIGRAKLYIQSEATVNSWDKLKDLLIEEFGIECNSAQLHEMLVKRTRRRTETIDEYFLIMKEMCSRGGLEDSALIQYVINGLEDSSLNKAILYGCKTLREFREKLRIYERIKTDDAKMGRLKGRVTRDAQSSPHLPRESDKRCYNCGKYGHIR